MDDVLQRWLSEGIATRRLVVLFCIAVTLVALVVRYPDAFHDANETARANAALDLVDRDIGAGNSVFPDQRLLVEARGLIAPDETFSVAAGDPQPGWTELTAGSAEPFLRYFLLPRRLDPNARWIICLWMRPRRVSRERARSGRARTASRSSGERHDVGRNSRAGRAERCVCGAGHHGPLGDPGLARWTDVLRLAGLAYLLAVALFGILWTQLRVFDVRFSGWGVVLSLIGRIRRRRVSVSFGRPLPRGYGDPNKHASSGACRHGGRSRADRAPLRCSSAPRGDRAWQANDAWAFFWIPKARRSTPSVTSTPRSSRPFPDRPTPPLSRSSTRRRPAMGGVDVSRWTCRYRFLVVWRDRGDRGLLYRTVPAGCSGLRLARPRRAARCGGTAGPRRTCSSTSCSSSVRSCSRSGAATGGTGVSPWSPVLFAGAGRRSARAPLRRIGAVIAFAVSLAAAGRLLRHRSAVAALVGVAALPWRLW